MRDSEIRGLQWGRMDLFEGYLTVGDSKTEAGEGPLNSDLLEAMVEYSKWYTAIPHHQAGIVRFPSADRHTGCGEEEAA